MTHTQRGLMGKTDTVSIECIFAFIPRMRVYQSVIDESGSFSQLTHMWATNYFARNQLRFTMSRAYCHSQMRHDGIADRPIAPRGALPPDALPTGADGSPAAAVTAAPPHPQPQPQPQPQPHPQPSPLPQPQQHPSLLIWSCSVVAGQPALSNARGRTMGSPPISAVA
jgi:hypothetical protein